MKEQCVTAESLICYICGEDDEMFTEIIFKDNKPYISCGACEGMKEISEEDYEKYRVEIEIAKRNSVEMSQEGKKREDIGLPF